MSSPRCCRFCTSPFATTAVPTKRIDRPDVFGTGCYDEVAFVASTAKNPSSPIAQASLTARYYFRTSLHLVPALKLDPSSRNIYVRAQFQGTIGLIGKLGNRHRLRLRRAFLERYGISAGTMHLGPNKSGRQRNAAHTIPHGLSHFDNGAGLHEHVGRETETHSICCSFLTNSHRRSTTLWGYRPEVIITTNTMAMSTQTRETLVDIASSLKAVTMVFQVADSDKDTSLSSAFVSSTEAAEINRLTSFRA